MEASSEISGRHYSCVQLAKLGLPDIPTTDRGVRELVERESWPFIEVKSRGVRGVRRDYLPPPAVQAQIDAMEGREMAAAKPAEPELAENGTGDAGLLRSPPRPEYAVNRAFRGGVVDAELLARVAIACSVVHGRDFDQVGLLHQVQGAAEAYNVLLSFASHLPGGPEALRQLDQEALVAQLRLLIQLGALKPWAPA